MIQIEYDDAELGVSVSIYKYENKSYESEYDCVGASVGIYEQDDKTNMMVLHLVLQLVYQNEN